MPLRKMPSVRSTYCMFRKFPCKAHLATVIPPSVAAGTSGLWLREGGPLSIAGWRRNSLSLRQVFAGQLQAAKGGSSSGNVLLLKELCTILQQALSLALSVFQSLLDWLAGNAATCADFFSCKAMLDAYWHQYSLNAIVAVGSALPASSFQLPCCKLSCDLNTGFSAIKASRSVSCYVFNYLYAELFHLPAQVLYGRKGIV